MNFSPDALPIPVWCLDPGDRLIACNSAYASLWGLTPDAAVAAQKMIAPKGTAQHHMIVGGARLLFSLTLTSVAGGGVIGHAVNITPQEDLAAELKRSQSATKELLEQLSTSVMAFSADHRLAFFNTACVRLWGLEESFLNMRPTLGDLIEKLRDLRRLPEQVDFRRYKQNWLDMFTNLIDPFDDMMYLPDGTALRMLVVPNPAGGLIFTFEDVTSRLALESSYNTLVAVQRETLDNLTEGIAVFGGDGRLQLWNPAFAQLWDLAPEDLSILPHVTQLVQKMKPSLALEGAAAACDRVMAQVLNGLEQSGRLFLTGGRLINDASVRLPDGGVLISHVDMTDTARVEQALRDKNKALETAERLKLDFLANVSYQLRTPLNAIMGFIQILDQEYFGRLNDKQKEYTHAARDASERLLALIDDILDLSTIEAGYLKLDYDEINIPDLLRVLQDLTREWARKEGMDVALDMPADIGRMIADPRRLKQILLNLVRNAIAYSPVGGTITVGARRAADHIDFWVKDMGMGIDPEDQSRVLEPFERGHMDESIGEARRTQNGPGLGLTLVKNITQLHGGHLKIESATGKGTLVTITLPLAPLSRMDNPSHNF